MRKPDLFTQFLLFMLGVLLGVLLVLFVDTTDPLPADAACGSIPYVFVNGVSTLDATSTNANNNFLLGCATSVDNTQIGSAGIYASQIIPGNQSTATFNGGSYGWRITVNAAGSTPLTIVQPTSPTADALAIFNNGLSTKYVWVDSGGVLHTNQAPVFNGVTFSPAGFVDTSSAQNVGGVKTFTSAPVMSGASISSGTIPLSSLASAPVTSVGATGNLSSSGGSTPTITESANPSWTTGAASLFKASEGAPNGSVGYSFSGDGGFDTGLFSAADGDLRLYANGAQVMGNGGSGVNVTFGGNVTATNFFITSKRSAKTNIHPLHLNALQILHDTCWATWHYKRKYGDPLDEHIGFIADCTPDVLSGPYHDHFDVPAVATVDALAVLQLEKRMDGLERMVRGLCKLPRNRKVKVCASVR